MLIQNLPINMQSQLHMCRVLCTDKDLHVAWSALTPGGGGGGHSPYDWLRTCVPSDIQKWRCVSQKGGGGSCSFALKGYQVTKGQKIVSKMPF